MFFFKCNLKILNPAHGFIIKLILVENPPFGLLFAAGGRHTLLWPEATTILISMSRRRTVVPFPQNVAIIGKVINSLDRFCYIIVIISNVIRQTFAVRGRNRLLRPKAANFL